MLRDFNLPIHLGENTKQIINEDSKVEFVKKELQSQKSSLLSYLNMKILEEKDQEKRKILIDEYYEKIKDLNNRDY